MRVKISGIQYIYVVVYVAKCATCLCCISPRSTSVVAMGLSCSGMSVVLKRPNEWMTQMALVISRKARFRIGRLDVPSCAWRYPCWRYYLMATIIYWLIYKQSHACAKNIFLDLNYFRQKLNNSSVIKRRPSGWPGHSQRAPWVSWLARYCSAEGLSTMRSLQVQLQLMLSPSQSGKVDTQPCIVVGSP